MPRRDKTREVSGPAQPRPEGRFRCRKITACRVPTYRFAGPKEHSFVRGVVRSQLDPQSGSYRPDCTPGARPTLRRASVVWTLNGRRLMKRQVR